MFAKKPNRLLILLAIVLSGCSKPQPCPVIQAAVTPAPPPPLAAMPIPPVAPPQAASKSDAKRVFAAHDCCDRYLNTEIYKVGALRARGRIFTVFQLEFINPENNHGMQQVAILDGLNLVGSHQTFGTDILLQGTKIIFECSHYERHHNADDCGDAGFQAIDLNEPQLPKTRVINGQISELSDSI